MVVGCVQGMKILPFFHGVGGEEGVCDEKRNNGKKKKKKRIQKLPKGFGVALLSLDAFCHAVYKKKDGKIQQPNNGPVNCKRSLHKRSPIIARRPTLRAALPGISASL